MNKHKRKKLPRPTPQKKFASLAAHIPCVAFVGVPDRPVRNGCEAFAGPVHIAHMERSAYEGVFQRAINLREQAETREWSRGDRRFVPVIAAARTDEAKVFEAYEPDAAPVVDPQAAERARAESQAYADELDAWLDRMAERGERVVPRGVQIKCDAHVQLFAKSADSMLLHTVDLWRP